MKSLAFDILRCLLLFQLIVPAPVWAFSSSEGADGTEGGSGEAIRDATTDKLYCSQAARGPVLALPNATGTLNSCGSYTVISTDIGQTAAGASKIPVAGTDSKLSISWLPTGTDSNSVAAGTDTRFGVWTGTATLTNYIPWTATGTGTAQIVTGSDSRLTDPRAPTGSIYAGAGIVLSTGTGTGTATSAALSASPKVIASGVATPSSPVVVGTVAVGTSPRGIAVAGRYVYTANYGESKMSAVDVSMPTAPETLGNVATGSGPMGVAISGRYAYTANYGASTVSALNLSIPGHPTALGSFTVGANSRAIAIAGRYLYVAYGASGFSVIDVASIPGYVVTGSVAVGANPSSIAVSGRYAYVANAGDSTVSVVDVSTPTAPSVVGSVSLDTGYVDPSPTGIAVSGRYAYTANSGNSSFSVVDISTPSAPSLLATFALDGNPTGIVVAGRYAYTANSGASTVSVIDISVPSSPNVVATVSVGANPESIAIAGRYLYTANYGDSTISVVDIGAGVLDAPAGWISSLQVGSIDVQQQLTVNQSASITGGLNVGRSLKVAEAIAANGAKLTGALELQGSSGGIVTVKPAASAGTWTLTFPTTPGNAGEALVTNGSGVTTWTAVGTSTSTLSVYAGNGIGISTGTSTTTSTSAALSSSPKFLLTATSTATSTAYVPKTQIINSHTLTETNITITHDDVGAAPAFLGSDNYIPRFTGGGTGITDAAPYSMSPGSSTIPLGDGDGRLDAWTTHWMGYTRGPTEYSVTTDGDGEYFVMSKSIPAQASSYNALITASVTTTVYGYGKCAIHLHVTDDTGLQVAQAASSSMNGVYNEYRTIDPIGYMTVYGGAARTISMYLVSFGGGNGCAVEVNMATLVIHLAGY